MRTNILRDRLRGHRMLGLAVLVMVLLACGSPKSSSTSGPEGGAVPTSKMTVDLKVETIDLSTAVVRASLNDGKSLATYYRLDGGDFFRACLNTVCKSMADNDSLDSPDYITRLDYMSGVDYVVSFSRQGAQNAPDSRVTLPPAFGIVTPANHQQVTNGETVQVSWSPTGAPALASLSFEAECDFLSGTHSVTSGKLSTDANADGREAVRIDTIVEQARANNASVITRCDIDIAVSHELQGRLDPAYHNGTVRGIVTRKVTLDFIPH